MLWEDQALAPALSVRGVLFYNHHFSSSSMTCVIQYYHDILNRSKHWCGLTCPFEEHIGKRQKRRMRHIFVLLCFKISSRGFITPWNSRHLQTLHPHFYIVVFYVHYRILHPMQSIAISWLGSSLYDRKLYSGYFVAICIYVSTTLTTIFVCFICRSRSELTPGNGFHPRDESVTE